MSDKTKDGGFRHRIMNAGFWSMGGHGVGQVTRLISNLIMTRLLVPEMFGIMAIANILLVGLALFSDIGLGQNIIHSKRGDEPLFLRTIWTIQIIRGVVIWIFAMAISGGLAAASHFGWLSGQSTYADPMLPLVIAVISFSAVISGFNSIRLASATRRLAQKQVTIMEIGSRFVGLAIMIAWAIIDRSIWALVAGGMAACISKMVLSHVILPGLPDRLGWNHEIFKEILQFGKWIFLSSIIGFLLNSGDRLLLGGLISTEALGLYSIAFLIINAIQQGVSKLSSSIVFPALSEVYRERKWQLKETYYKFRLWLDVGILFIAGFMFMAGETLIDILYDERYAEAGPMVQVLSLVMIARRYALADQCYLAMGKPNLLTALIWIRVMALYVFVILGFHAFDLFGALWGIVISSFASVPVSLYFKSKYKILDLRKEILVLPIIIPGAVLGMMMNLLLLMMS